MKKIKRAVYILGCWILMNCVCAAAESEGERWMKTVYNEENGLPTGEANVVLQTMDGYIWIGSYGGLIRYDGRDFRNFSTEDNGLESSSIRALYEDRNGILYIGTNDKGIYRYRGNEFIRLVCEENVELFQSVRTFTADSEGNVYAGTTTGIAKIGETGVWAVSGTEDYTVYDMTCDKNGVLWAGSDYNLVLAVQDEQVISVMDSSEWMEEGCYSVLAGSDGTVYVGSSGNEVVKLTFKDENYEESSFSVESVGTDVVRTINKLYEDRNGLIWVMADNGMGYITREKEFVIPDVMQGMLSNCAAVQDYEGNLWTASSRTGISYFSTGKYYNYNRISGLEGMTINVVVKTGEFWYVGTDSGVIVLDEEMKQVQNELTECLMDTRVRHIMCTKEGEVWFSLYGSGAARYLPEENELLFYTEQDGLLNDWIRMTLELRDGSIAVAGSGGINIIKENKVVKSYGADVLAYPFILCMYQQEDGTLVAGTDGVGFYTISEDEVTQYYKESGLDSGVVMRMAPDEKAGGVWIAAGSSLYFWDHTSVEKIALSSGVGSVLDIKVIEDEIWLMKSNGPIVIEREALLGGASSGRELSRKYGLTGMLVANSWNWLDEEERLWLCTNNGVSVIDTGEIPVNQTPPKGAVTSVVVDTEVYEQPLEVYVSASARRITLNLAAISYTPADKSIAYYLEGFDEQVILCDAGKTPSVSYTNLSGGNYTFHMKVYNEDGMEGDSCEVRIYKEYHLWEHGWFWGAVVLAALLLVLSVFLLIYRAKVNSMKKRQAEYKAITEQAMKTFAHTIDAKDKDTNGHSVRVAGYSKELARRLKMSADEQETIFYMALLHDIGKIGIPDEILKKTGKLTEKEWEIIKSHPVIGADILNEFTAIEGFADGIRYHHEFYNGQGYCEGLKGEEIPLIARIIAVADAFDAMSSRRYYRESNTLEYARAEMVRCSGTQFDPKIAEKMISMIDDGFVHQVQG